MCLLASVVLLASTSTVGAKASIGMQDPEPSNLWLFLIGCVGALSPDIVRLYNLRNSLTSVSIPFPYFLISLAMALLGGLIALIQPTTTYYGAFYAGIAAPAIIATARKQTEGEGAPAAEASPSTPTPQLPAPQPPTQAPREARRPLSSHRRNVLRLTTSIVIVIISALAIILTPPQPSLRDGGPVTVEPVPGVPPSLSSPLVGVGATVPILLLLVIAIVVVILWRRRSVIGGYLRHYLRAL
jgi:hypothetical protein